MKRIVALCLTLSLSAVVAGCGGSDSAPSADGTTAARRPFGKVKPTPDPRRVNEITVAEVDTLPADWPADTLSYPDMKLISVKQLSRPNGTSVTARVAADWATVAAHYNRTVKAAGYSVFPSDKPRVMAVRQGEQTTSMITIQPLPEQPGSGLVISIDAMEKPRR